MKSIKKHSVKSCAINKISQFSSVKILNKMQNLLKFEKLIQGVFVYQINVVQTWEEDVLGAFCVMCFSS